MQVKHGGGKNWTSVQNNKEISNMCFYNISFSSNFHANKTVLTEVIGVCMT